ncbi:rRNA maturation RNase YbeY [Candidatus Gottesmanbacteria bacterium]|nr:rRNA maturation RNase YbeY [Candidatus Gottesmanbacteria bacterium]
MNKINIFNEKKYPIKVDRVKQIVNKTLRNQKIKLKTEVNINFVDDPNMTVLHKKFMYEDGTTDVLSFPIEELKSDKGPKIKFKNPGNLVQLGDIVVCYPQAKRQAKNYDLTTSEEINRLVEHGLLHLLGIHHE